VKSAASLSRYRSHSKHKLFIRTLFHVVFVQWEDRIYGAGACALVAMMFGFGATMSVWSFNYTTFGDAVWSCKLAAWCSQN